MEFQKRLAEGTILFDGAMGTYFAQRYGQPLQSCELANLTHAREVLEIHRAYVGSGCDAIKTNTFGANTVNLGCDRAQVMELIDKGWELAIKAAVPEGVSVFADIGPISPTDEGNEMEEYQAILDRFLSLGARHFLFETFGGAERLPDLCAYVKARQPESFIICSFAVGVGGYTREGAFGTQLYRDMCADPHTDAVGFNCGIGPNHMRKLVSSLERGGKPLAIMPNAGYPTVVGNRTSFGSSADYFANIIGELAAGGVEILGGCCGSTPEFIRKSRHRLSCPAGNKIWAEVKKPLSVPPAAPNRIKEKLASGKKLVAVELDPPASSDMRGFMEGARQLQQAGVDAITIADCPVSRARADSSLLACKLKWELDIDVIPHMTCRDRNLNATKALLLGLNSEGINNVLAVTGDPIPTAERSEIKSVYNFNSPMLISFIQGLEEGLTRGPFQVFGALNINAGNFEAQLRHAERKIKAGAAGFFTQPVHSKEALENLRLARARLGRDIKLMGGVMPIISHRNACFMNNEISGIRICDDIVRRYEGKDREEAGNLAVEITAAIAREMAKDVDGYYIVTPFLRTDLVCRVLEEIDVSSVIAW